MLVNARYTPMDRSLLRGGAKFDHSLLWMLALLLGFSLIMVYSASIANAIHYNGSPVYYLKRQALSIGLGLILALFAAATPMRVWQRFTPLILMGSIAMLVLAVAVAPEAGGARRWIPLGGFNFQPSELFKLAAVLYLASFLTRRTDILTRFERVWWVFVPIGIGLAFVLMTRDLGSAVVVGAIAISLLFVGGLPFRWFLFTVVLGVAVMMFLIWLEPYRMSRIYNTLDPWKDPLGKGYQLTHSLMAFGRGGWFGVGLGASMEKRFYLSQAHTDFILAIISEELGFVGVIVLGCAYVWLVWRTFQIGRQAYNLELYFGAFVARGMGLWIGIQSFVNFGVNVGILPTKGLTLPLISYGGSSMMVMIVALALVLRVDWENRRVMRGFKI